jgi:dienelactone hydrolase
MMGFMVFVLGVLMLIPGAAFGKIEKETVEYGSGKTIMEGYYARDNAIKGAVPGILIVHDWMGLGEFQKEKAEKLASLGYAAFAVDIYGKGIRPKNMEEAAKLATYYKSRRDLIRERIRAAYDTIKTMKGVNPDKIVVMGYCFGGTVALELARSGAPLAGTVSFHGGLSTPSPADAKNIKGRVLVMHGADDPNVPADEVKAFKEEMKNAHVEMKFIAYKGAVHAFTNPAAGNDNSKGAAYNAKADKKSWAELIGFLKEATK